MIHSAKLVIHNRNSTSLENTYRRCVLEFKRYAEAYQQLPEKLNGWLCSKLLLDWHVDVINKQNHPLAYWWPISACTLLTPTSSAPCIARQASRPCKHESTCTEEADHAIKMLPCSRRWPLIGHRHTAKRLEKWHAL